MKAMILGVAVATSVVLTACGSGETTTGSGVHGAQPPGSCVTDPSLVGPSGGETVEVHADELVVAGTVRELADESTLVLVGRVVDAEMSDLVADSDDGAGVQMEHLSVEVESMLTGDEARVEGGEVTVRQAATDHGKVPVTNGLPPARVGQCAVFFLAESSKDGVWRLTSTQGRYLIDPEGRLIGAHAHGSGADVIEKIEGMTVAELQAEVG